MSSTNLGREKTHKKALRSGFAAAVGTTVEWYDFYVYATAAAIVFPQLFFPEVDRSLGTLASFGTYAVAFFMRPIGGVLFGHIGDKLGRKPALTITLMVMGVATVLVGCLPSYAMAGMLGPILLIVLRMFQGLAVGGEWGGASLMAVESAPEKWKTFYGGFTQLGNPFGALLSSGAFWVLAAMGDDVLMTWGWRIPFLFSLVLIGVGIWVRLRVEETPVFEDKVEGAEQSTPILYALKFNWWPILLGFGIVAMSSGGYVVATSFVQNYATDPEVGVKAQVILAAMTVASFIEAIVTLPLAWLGDKWGGKTIMYLGIGLSFLTMIPLILAIEGRNVVLIFLLVSLVRLTLSGAWAPLSTLMAQMFKPQARYTSMSLAYGVGAAVWGGLSPAIASGLLAATGSIWSVVAFFGLLSLVAWLGTAFAPQYSDSNGASTPSTNSTIQPIGEK
ncbi:MULTISPECIES: MFS transporter [Micrococcaceae]|uniref:MFS transporter n=1 Tax=unclassified Kocuria TaxID=2649579 RepID=UPI00101045D7|nr:MULTISPECIES: MFS transporter [unclassified Kocuria]